MEGDLRELKDSIISIASELFRFQHTYESIVARLDISEQKKYMSQFGWFSKKVYSAVEKANIKLINLEGKIYDPGMAVTPLNIEDFGNEDTLYVSQMIEPIVMEGDTIIKEGTVILEEMRA